MKCGKTTLAIISNHLTMAIIWITRLTNHSSASPRKITPLAFRLHQSSFVRYENSSSNISKTVLPRLTKFYRDINTDIVNSHTGYDVIIYFRSEVIGGKRSKIPTPSPTASGGISRERFKLIEDKQPYKPAGNGITSSFLLSAKCYQILQKSAQTGPKCRKRLVTRKWYEIWQTISVLHREGRLQISRVKNIDRVFELNGVAFRLDPPFGWFLVLALCNDLRTSYISIKNGLA